MATDRRRVVLAGAAGLVGHLILDGLLANEAVESVYVVARRPLSKKHAKMTVQIVDFSALPVFPPLNELYLALGTTIKVAGMLIRGVRYPTRASLMTRTTTRDWPHLSEAYKRSTRVQRTAHGG